jgi:hypothetical protein
MSQSKEDLLRTLPLNYRNAFSALSEVKTLDDFNNWLRNASKHIDSDALGVYNGVSPLDALFGE